MRLLRHLAVAASVVGLLWGCGLNPQPEPPLEQPELGPTGNAGGARGSPAVGVDMRGAENAGGAGVPADNNVVGGNTSAGPIGAEDFGFADGGVFVAPDAGDAGPSQP